MGKYHANKGVARNKKPLQNVVYKIVPVPLDSYNIPNRWYVFWQYQKAFNREPNCMNWDVKRYSKEDIKKLLSEKQYNKFCQGQELFIVQRRINGKNVPLND